LQAGPSVAVPPDVSLDEQLTVNEVHATVNIAS
jgi:hypothetical protein